MNLRKGVDEGFLFSIHVYMIKGSSPTWCCPNKCPYTDERLQMSAKDSAVSCLEERSLNPKPLNPQPLHPKLR